MHPFENALRRAFQHAYETVKVDPAKFLLQLRAAYDLVAGRRGEEYAKALFIDNPLAAFEGRSLPYEPEQADPDAKPMQYRKRKRFLFF